MSSVDLVKSFKDKYQIALSSNPKSKHLDDRWTLLTHDIPDFENILVNNAQTLIFIYSKKELRAY